MKYLFGTLLIVTLFACNEEQVEAPKEPSIEEMKSNPLQEYIYFEDGDSVFFYNQPFQADTVLNRYDEDLSYTFIHMSRPNDPFYCNINIAATNIYDRILPYTLGTHGGGSFGMVYLRHSTIYVEDLFSATDTVSYLSRTQHKGGVVPGGLEMKIISLEGSWITLSFEGFLWQASNSEDRINIENGEARILLKQ